MASEAGTARRDAVSSAGAKTPAQMYAYAVGGVLLLVGLPGVKRAVGGKLLGIFEVNGIHNLVHIASGLLLLAVAPKRATARYGVIAFGLVYGLVTLIGLIDGRDVLGLIPVNPADNVLHIALTAGALLAGFLSPADDARTTRDNQRTVG